MALTEQVQLVPLPEQVQLDVPAANPRLSIDRLAGFRSDADIARSNEAGFTLHLVKPVDPDLLIELLRDVGISR